MTIKVTYSAFITGAQREGKRYVRTLRPNAEYVWCVRDALDPRYDVQQGTCNAEDVPKHIRALADLQQGRAFSYVEWPK
jgi:hypothetical protein